MAGLHKLTLIDYPCKLACTVFCIGCNVRSPLCFNPDLVAPSGYISPKTKILERNFLRFLKERKNFLEAVVIGGGEPTIQEDLPEFFQKIKDMGYLIKLDTNGSNPELLKNTINTGLIDYVAMDIKAPRQKYIQTIGLQSSSAGLVNIASDLWGQEIIKNIEKSIHILKEDKVNYEFRTTFVPGLIRKKDILDIVHWIKPAKKYFIQNFRPQRTLDPKLKKTKPYSLDYLVETQKAIAPFFEICQIRE